MSDNITSLRLRIAQSLRDLWDSLHRLEDRVKAIEKKLNDG